MNEDLMQKLAPVPRRVPLMPPLSPPAELALLCRLLFAEGYDDHIAGHVTLKQPDGTILCSPFGSQHHRIAARRRRASLGACPTVRGARREGRRACLS